MRVMRLPALSLPNGLETHVWQLYLPDFRAKTQQWLAWLSADEHDRAQRFYRSEDRDRFILSRGGLRYLIARYLICSPEAVAFAYSDYGKPSLANPSTALSFNLAHSGKWVVYVFGRCEHVGVDVEQVVLRTQLDGLVQRCLTPNEQARLPQSAPDRLQGFFQYWTIKEAHLKAIGLGLSYPMTEVEVAWQPEPHLVRPAEIPTASITSWAVRLWFPADDAIAAVCVGQTSSKISIRPFPT